MVASFLTPSPSTSSRNIPLGPGFFEVSWDAPTKPPGEKFAVKSTTLQNVRNWKEGNRSNLSSSLSLKQVWLAFVRLNFVPG